MEASRSLKPFIVFSHTMANDVPVLAVSRDTSIEFRLSDISASPVASPYRPQGQRSQCVDAKRKQKWKRQIQRERSYERKNGEKAKLKTNDSKGSSIIEVRIIETEIEVSFESRARYPNTHASIPSYPS